MSICSMCKRYVHDPVISRIDGYDDQILCRSCDDLNEGRVCHCGDSPTTDRGLCDYCDSVRCDAYPGACREDYEY